MVILKRTDSNTVPVIEIQEDDRTGRLYVCIRKNVYRGEHRPGDGPIAVRIPCFDRAAAFRMFRGIRDGYAENDSDIEFCW